MSRVTELRHARNMTQDQFAEFCDVSHACIARYDAGAPISRKNAEKIAKACKVSVDYVLEMDANPEEGETMLREGICSLTQEEKKLVQHYRELTAKGKMRVVETMEELIVVYPKK